MTPKEQAQQLENELKMEERKLYLLDDMQGVEDIRRKRENIRKMFDLTSEVVDNTCESCQ